MTARSPGILIVVMAVDDPPTYEAQFSVGQITRSLYKASLGKQKLSPIRSKGTLVLTFQAFSHRCSGLLYMSLGQSLMFLHVYIDMLC